MATTPAVLGPNTRLNNFRLNYLTADQAAERPTHIRIILGGIDITKPDAPMRVIYKSMTIRDALFDAPNTCDFTVYGSAPNVGQPLEVWVNSNAPVLLFSGEIQTVARTYKGRPTTVLHPVTAIDDTARANRKRPLRRYVHESADNIAKELIALYVPGFSSAGVEFGLPAVSITFDGSEAGMKGCLTALAKLIGGYWYFENKTLYFFVTPPGTPPDPIDETPGRFLHDPAISATIDKSQVRTRVYGKGASTRVLAAIDAGATLIPIENAEMFNPAGGQAIAAVVPDGAAFQRVAYTGVQLGGGGGLVGPGAAPSATPNLALLDGAGLHDGPYKYAYTFTTASGESLLSPIGTITAGVTAPPTTAPIPGTVQTGGSVDPGTHSYAVTFVTAAGETTPSPGGAPVTTSIETTGAAAEIAAPSVAGVLTTAVAGGALVPGNYYYRVEFVTAHGSTGWGWNGNIFSANLTTAVNPMGVQIVALPIGPTGVTARRIYRIPTPNSTEYFTAAAYKLLATIPNNVTTQYTDTAASTSGASIPTVNTTANPGTTTLYQRVPLSGIPIGPPNVTARKLYRASNGVGYKYLATIPNNTATTYTDTAPSANLAGQYPSVNTAFANQVRVIVALGGSGVTGRKVYRSGSGGASLHFLTTIADNTTQTIIDAAPDAALGAVAPTLDTSGLAQPAGQVPAGSTSMIVANTAAFAEAGGWAVVGNGEQVIRYTGKTATTVTGIPPSGSGALVASVSYNSTITAAPALVGVTGLVEAIIRNSAIHVWVQRDDLAAQALMSAYDGGGDGVYEHIWSDERRSEASLAQVCEAQLQLYSRPLVTVTYATRDLKTKSGKTVTIDLATPAIAEALTIQDVAISELGIRGLRPKFTVTASSVRQSLEAVLQMLIRKADA
jgi:hypothetical protein